MSIHSLADRPASPTNQIPGEVESAVRALAEESPQIYALISSAKQAIADGNRFTAFELLEMAEDMAGNTGNLKTVGDFLGIDTERQYPFSV